MVTTTVDAELAETQRLRTPCSDERCLCRLQHANVCGVCCAPRAGAAGARDGADSRRSRRAVARRARHRRAAASRRSTRSGPRIAARSRRSSRSRSNSYLKGALGPTLRFRVPGGELGRFRSIVVGAPEFAVDERVVVFLGARGPSVPYVLGLSQGVFRVVRAADNCRLARDVARAAAGRRRRRAASCAATRRAGALPLGDFEQRVRALARRCEVRRPLARHRRRGAGRRSARRPRSRT